MENTQSDQAPKVSTTDTGFSVEYPGHTVGVQYYDAKTPDEALKIADKLHKEFLGLAPEKDINQTEENKK